MDSIKDFSSITIMGITPKGLVNYVLFDNPVSKTVISPFVSKATATAPVSNAPAALVPTPLWKLAYEHGPYVRIAGICGATAVILGAYGAHKSYPKDSAVELKSVYETANRFHFLHSLALLGVPLCRYPQVTGTLILVGSTLFCGTCYYRAFTGENKFGKLAPIGGTVLIFAWLSMVL